MELKYDAFISYKRNGGTAWAELVYLALKKIKKKMIADIEATGEFEGFEDYYKEAINSKKASDFNFYILRGGRCVVTFDPYELGWGGWTREYIIFY